MWQEASNGDLRMQVKEVGRIVLKTLPYMAIIYAGAYVYNIDRNLLFREFDPAWLSISVLGLIAHFFTRGFYWYAFLSRFNVKISLGLAFTSIFSTALMRYIPGKVFSILGRAQLVSLAGYPLSYCVFLSTATQIVQLVCGFLLGAIGIFMLDAIRIDLVPMAIVSALVCFAIFMAKGRPIPRLLRKHWVPENLRPLLGERIPPVGDLFGLIFIHWLILGSAYAAFLKAAGLDVGILPMFIQPMANTLGIVAIFAPGGIGVREGAMVTYLTLTGVDINTAIGVSVTSRVWFLCGEVTIFVVGTLMRSRLLLPSEAGVQAVPRPESKSSVPIVNIGEAESGI